MLCFNFGIFLMPPFGLHSKWLNSDYANIQQNLRYWNRTATNFQRFSEKLDMQWSQHISSFQELDEDMNGTGWSVSVVREIGWYWMFFVEARKGGAETRWGVTPQKTLSCLGDDWHRVEVLISWMRESLKPLQLGAGLAQREACRNLEQED